MPLKIILLIVSLWGAGFSIAGYLLYQLFRSGHFLRYGVALLSLAALAFGLSYIYLPCFPYQTSTVMCHIPKNQKSHQIALTFDDGPQSPYTEEILDILKKENIPATFFILGKYAEKNPNLVKRIVTEGHAIGNHGWSHIPLAFKNREFIQTEIESWEKVMSPWGEQPYKIFRASHGWKNPWLVSILHQKGYQLIGWNVGVWDSDKPGKDVLLERLNANLDEGSIILLHDGDGDHEGADRSQTVAILPELIRECRSRGYTFVTIPEMMNKP